MKMQRRDWITYGAVAAILVIAVAGGLYFKPKHSSSTASDNTNTPLPAVPKNPITLTDVCAHCSVLAGDESGTYLIDAVTKAKKQTVSESADASFMTLQSRFLAPSGSSEIVVSDDYLNLYQITFPLGTPKLLYTAKSNEAINFVSWAPDEKTVVFGIGASTDANTSAADVLPTDVYTLNLTTGKASKTFSASSVSGTALPNAVPVAVTNGGQRIIVAVVDTNNTVSFYYWDAGAQFLKKSPAAISVDMYFAHTGGTTDRLLWSSTDGLHAALLKDFSEKTYAVKTFSDAPYGMPSPDGTKVVYLKANDKGDAGIPTLLDLNTGAETALTTDTVTDSSGMLGSFWTPDGTWFVFEDFTAATPLSRALNVTLTDQHIRDISDPALPAAYQVYSIVK